LKNIKINISTILCVLIFANSCNKIIPLKFWANYKNSLIIQNIGDQGTYGGNLAMHWKSETKNTFKSEEVIKFAKENGWTLTGTKKFNSKSIEKWKDGEKLIFPLNNLGFDPKVENDLAFEKFPR
jgi:hypothetical protein